MKDLLLLFLISFTLNLSSQNTKLWPEEFEAQSLLDSSDVTFESGQYYKSSEISLLAGEGIFLYMIATDFVPQLYSTDITMKVWGLGSNTKLGSDINLSYLPIIALNDTLLNVVYSSTEKSMSGNFAYGFKKLSSAQMQFDTMSAYCDKLSFLINNWQCWWELVSKEDFYPTWGQPNRTPNISLVYKGSVFMRMNGLTSYEEIIFMEKNMAEAKSKYGEIIGYTKSCLSAEEWDITNSDTNFEDGVNLSHITQFTLKGSEPGQMLRSFEIALYCDDDPECDVTIYFH